MTFCVYAVIKDSGLFWCLSKFVLLIFGLFLLEIAFPSSPRMERKRISDINASSLAPVNTATESVCMIIHILGLVRALVEVERDA